MSTAGGGCSCSRDATPDVNASYSTRTVAWQGPGLRSPGQPPPLLPLVLNRPGSGIDAAADLVAARGTRNSRSPCGHVAAASCTAPV
eukprot:scaffold94296_cov20-Tisochrysis_lutea.AAC.1